MKLTVAVFTVLIVGSNAGLLGNLVNPVVDSATAVNKANALLSTFLTQINEVATSEVNDFFQQSASATANVPALVNSALSAAQVDLSVSDFAELSSEAATALADLVSSGIAAVTQANTAVSGLAAQITNTVSPYITALGAQILSNSVKLQCFTNQVPDIQTRIGEVVNSTRNDLAKAVSDSLAPISQDVENIQNIVTRLQNDIQTQTLSFVSSF